MKLMYVVDFGPQAGTAVEAVHLGQNNDDTIDLAFEVDGRQLERTFVHLTDKPGEPGTAHLVEVAETPVTTALALVPEEAPETKPETKEPTPSLPPETENGQ